MDSLFKNKFGIDTKGFYSRTQFEGFSISLLYLVRLFPYSYSRAKTKLLPTTSLFTVAYVKNFPFGDSLIFNVKILKVFIKLFILRRF